MRHSGLAALVLMAPLTFGAADTPPRDVLPTGAGFSLSIARATAELHHTAATLQSSGLPAFPRYTSTASQVIVGPYAALDEAEAVQRALKRGGVRSRLLVDESVRRVPHQAATYIADAASVLLISGGGRLSLVIELPSEPRHVFTHRGGSLLDVDAGPMTQSVAPRRWLAPSGVGELQQVSTETINGALRTRVVLPETTRTAIRVLGRRLYIDLWSLESEMVGSPLEAVGRPILPPPAARTLAVREDAGVTYEEEIAPALARFHSMEPFVMAALAAPSPEVLGALNGSLGALEEWIGEVEPPAESAAQHDELRARVRQLRDKVSAATPHQP